VAPGIGPAKDRQRDERDTARSGLGPHFTVQPTTAGRHAALRTERDRRCWGLSIGVAGMLSQMKGLAQAVSCEFEPRRTRLRRFWRWMPLALVPRTFAVIRDAGEFTSEEPPRLVIACGRHAVIPAICLKRQWGVRIVTVFVQDPLVDTRNFDFVVAPEHDEVRGPNVISTRGALHHVSAAVLSAARQTKMAQYFLQTGRPIATVLLGGPNRYYAFSQTDVSRLIDKLHIAARDDVQLLIVPSRRTPADMCFRFQSEFGQDHLVWDGQDENPYLAALAVADFVIVTGDSVSMTTEASATGKPVFVEYLRERLPARRFRKFHFSFRHAGITRPFEGRLHRWTYSPPDDTAEVARRIKERMGLPCPS
jgi:mitochondrial fission protein ELM1